MRLRHAISIYFVVQALAVSCWWFLLFAYPNSIHWFQPKQWPIETLSWFWLVELLWRYNDWQEILVVILSDCHYHQGNRYTTPGGVDVASPLGLSVLVQSKGCHPRTKER